jgi:hypothetical protein
MSRRYNYPKTHTKKYNTDLCDDKMTFQDCELAILRHAVDESEKVQGQKVAASDDVKKMIKIVEDFLIRKKLICYGGTAINNILPKSAQFYNKELEVPDYDFFTDNALDDAKELADIYHTEGYSEVEAKAGMHSGTFKVFVNFIPVADITQLNQSIFDAIKSETITIAGIKYAPPNFLRMSMYLELSRPAGDVSRWEKVLKRLTLLNKYYPLNAGSKCSTVEFQQSIKADHDKSEKLYFTTRDVLIEQGVIFFGGYATSLYLKHAHSNQQRILKKIPDFDVLAEDPERCAMITKERLAESGFDNIKETKHEAIGEIIPEHIEISVGKETIAFIYKPIACHNYNTIEIGEREVNVATIDTMLSFYLAFLYAAKPYYHKDRILCMAKFLFDVEQNNRLEQRGLLKRFSISCYGKQPTMEDMRGEKAEKFKELMGKRGTAEYDMWFLKYNPANKGKLANVKASNVKKTKEAVAEMMPDSKIPEVPTGPTGPTGPVVPNNVDKMIDESIRSSITKKKRTGHKKTQKNKNWARMWARRSGYLY